MSLSISIRFLTGRAHLHPWQTHHSEGRVEWPPSQWRLLRALVAVAGRGLKTLPLPDEGPPPKPEPKAEVKGLTSLKKRGVSEDARKKLSLSGDFLTLKEPLTDAEADAWRAANPGEAFSAAIDRVRALMSAPPKRAMEDTGDDEIPLSRLARLLASLSTTPSIWLPKTAGGHTRQYFPTGDPDPERWIAPTGSAVFDTFATVCKDQPLVFHWPEVSLEQQQLADLRLILGRMTYFGRAESWCRADVHAGDVKELADVVTEGAGQTHWRCVCIEDGGKPDGKEYRDYTLERRLAPCKDVRAEVKILLPRTNRIANSRPEDEASFGALLADEPAELSLLRCLLRESGHDIKDGLERPIGTRWVHYAVPRAIYDVPRRSPQPRPRDPEAVDLVVYALNTATVHRPVLPPLTDTLLVADRFRSAAMALCVSPSRSLSGRESDGEPCKDHDHAFWWPRDEDNDGFIDHVYVRAQGGFTAREVDALRRLSRLRQRGGRPDLLVTPIFVGRAAEYPAWQGTATTFVSATPYFCPLHLSHGRTGGSRIRPVTPVIRESLQRQGLISDANEVESITELVFDYDPDTLPTPSVVEPRGGTAIPPRQYFPVIEPPANPTPLAERSLVHWPAYPGACRKDPDQGYPFGLSVGLFVCNQTRFVRALAFCRNRRGREVKGYGRMLEIRFRTPRYAHPFAIGSECHFGLGLFVSVDEAADRPVIAESV
ncbi:MAG: hypothetical protein SNJ75_12445 [Gemmataceae bacterium]